MHSPPHWPMGMLADGHALPTAACREARIYKSGSPGRSSRLVLKTFLQHTHVAGYSRRPIESHLRSVALSEPTPSWGA